MTSVDKLKSEIAGRFGVARGNRYRVIFPAIEFEMGAEAIDVLCDSVSIPGRQIFTTERYTDMKARKVAYGFGAEDVDISFILTNDWSVWNYLYRWHELVINNVNILNSYTVNFKEDYAKQIDIEHLNESAAAPLNKRISLDNAYPTSLNAIELANASENEIIRVTASFSYDNWRRNNYGD